MPRPVNSCSQVDPGAQNIVTSTDPATGYKTLLLVPLVFSATADRYFRAFDDRSGKVLWRSPRLMEASPDHGESRVSSRSPRGNGEETDKSVAFSELHALTIADIDGDGLKDIVTGKRWWSHGDNFSGPDAKAPPVLYWFKLVRKPGGEVEFVPHLINKSGVGTQIVAIDMNGDGRPDILISGRKGPSFSSTTSITNFDDRTLSRSKATASTEL